MSLRSQIKQVHKRKHPARKTRRQGRWADRLLLGGICASLFLVAFGGSFIMTQSQDDPFRARTEEGHNASFMRAAHAAADTVSEAPAEPVPAMPDREAESLSVQAVLSPKRQAVIASAIDGKITKFNVDNGDTFKKNDILVEYDCGVDRARLKEAESRRRVTGAQLEAYEKLLALESVSDMELVMARENHEQNKALVDQIRGRLQNCKVEAPFDGRVTNKIASAHEFVQTGRVLMDITSRESLRASFLIPSRWLRWLNVGTPLRIYISETGRDYGAEIIAIHGEVDPVSQSVQVVAEIESYYEELLPGMSGTAKFDANTIEQGRSRGFLGLILRPGGMENNGDQEK